jgi:hypothetical protein
MTLIYMFHWWLVLQIVNSIKLDLIFELLSKWFESHRWKNNSKFSSFHKFQAIFFVLPMWTHHFKLTLKPFQWYKYHFIRTSFDLKPHFWNCNFSKVFTFQVENQFQILRVFSLNSHTSLTLCKTISLFTSNYTNQRRR